ncbi:carbamoyltransferase HypF [Pasteurellaceae bacterium 15-036681]|nr:carbamoyltransferase HypF [Pasteurellaceae bacterium 15-036681]
MKFIELRIKGKVQGVGFRPFVWLLAKELQLKGDVNNDGQGVLIRFQAPTEAQLTRFIQDLTEKLPPLAKITDIQQQEKQIETLPYFEDFTIRESENNAMDTQIVPDAATCPTCIAELFDPNNRRFHYPFTNCTHCGPRFTIIRAIPYDRPNTSMADFPFCPECETEYKDPADRRFHAQPNACPSCGPHIWLQNKTNQLATHEDALQQTVELLIQGKIVAIKGLGGFHLACDATNSDAVNLLRQRKNRPNKPLAVMVPTLNFLTDLVPEEQQLLTSSAAPIVLLKKHKAPRLCEQIALNLAEVGIMLPSNPLQHLLLNQANRPLVMTSANPSGEPPVLDNRDAIEKLGSLADFYLCHNRDILQRADDSLVRFAFDGLETLRRARGYVPDETELNITAQRHILALGSDLKNTFCLQKGNKAVVSQHIGDTSNLKVQKQLNDNLQLFQQIYQFQPNALAVDAHSGYFSSQIGKQLASEQQLPIYEVLHHHAHISAVLAEHHCNDKVIGIALDGIGMGENEQLWGGECLLVDKHHCQHLGGLPPVALAGGDLAAKQPWRNWLAHIQQFLPNWQEIANSTLQPFNWQILARAIEAKINSPVISSTGRLFDAVAYALGIAPNQLSWEGEAACHLETLASQSQWVHKSIVQIKSTLNIAMPIGDNNQLDLATFWRTWLNLDCSVEDKAFAFHFALATGFADMARENAQKYGCQTIVLSGGVMHNQLLRQLLKENLSDFNVLSGQQYPMNDGGLSLGQSWIVGHLIESN